jgi:hypothetical protein
MKTQYKRFFKEYRDHIDESEWSKFSDEDSQKYRRAAEKWWNSLSMNDWKKLEIKYFGRSDYYVTKSPHTRTKIYYFEIIKKNK